MQKGVSAIIAIILLLMIVVAITGLAYMFFSGLFTSSTTTTEQTISKSTTSLLAQMKIESLSINDVYVRNIGQSDLTDFSVYINDEPANFDINPAIIRKGETGTVKIYDFIKEGDDIKITTAEGILSSYKAPDPCKEAFLCLNFDEGSGTMSYDSGGHTGNNGVFSGENFNSGTSYSNTMPTDLHTVSGRYGNALSFDGVDDYVRIDNIPVDTSLGASNTVMFWMYWNGINGQMPIGWQQSYDLYITSGCFGFNTGESNVLGVSSSNLTNKWVHITAIFYNGIPSSSTVSLYIDGVKQNIYPCIGNTTGSRSVTSTLIVSGWGVSQSYKLSGKIDELRIFNRALNQSEIQTEMDSNEPVLRPVASYSFEESGSYANDTHIWVKGRYGPALSFDGINDYVNASNSSKLNLNYITIAAWVYPLGNYTENQGQVAGKFNWGSNQGYIVQWYNDTQRIVLAIGNGINWGQLWSSSNTVPRNQWTYIVGTYDGSYMRIYINGVLNVSTPGSGVIAPSINNLMIGAESSGYKRFWGIIDEIRIFNRAI